MQKYERVILRFAHAVSFIDCDLTSATFVFTCLQELDTSPLTTLNIVLSRMQSSKMASDGSKTDKTSFDDSLRSSLKSNGKIA